MSYGLRFLSAVLAEQDISKLLKYGKIEHLFDLDPVAKPVGEFVVSYVVQTGKIPPIEVVEEELDITIKAEDAAPEWLHVKAMETHVQRTLRLMVEDNKEDFKADPMKALQSMAATIQMLQAQKEAPNIVDFKEALTTLWPYLQGKWLNKDTMVEFGWPYLDAMCGGLRPGDLISLVGRPAQGKSFFMLWIALNVWRKLKQPVVFVSMEMSREVVMERLAAIAFEMPMDFFKYGGAANLFVDPAKLKDKKYLKKKLEELMTSDEAPFIVVDANLTGTVADVVGVVQQYGAVACFVDGAYLMEAPVPTQTIYQAVAINVTLFKKHLAKLVPTVCSWQFAKLEKKLRKGEKPTLENIGYSDTIATHSSIVMGLMQTEDQANIENVMQRVIDLLKGRGGEIGEFVVNWDFNTMDFSQYIPPDTVQVFN